MTMAEEMYRATKDECADRAAGLSDLELVTAKWEAFDFCLDREVWKMLTWYVALVQEERRRQVVAQFGEWRRGSAQVS